MLTPRKRGLDVNQVGAILVSIVAQVQVVIAAIPAELCNDPPLS